MESDRIVLIRRLLRLIGAVDCLAIVAVLMPRPLIESISLRLGFAPFPSGPLAEYLARSTSLLYALHGALLLFVAGEVVRYWGLIRWLGWLAAVHGALMLVIDLQLGMPGWWCLVEGPTFAASGLLLLALTKCGQHERRTGRN
jgi:hypothetical protein